MRALIVLMLAAAVATPAEAHGTSPSARWTLDPAILVPLAISLALFLVGWGRLRARSSGGLHRRGPALFLAGWTILGLAVISPLHAAGERSFAAHMAEHELLMLAAAPLLVLSRPLGPMLWAFPSRHGGALALRPASWRPCGEQLRDR